MNWKKLESLTQFNELAMQSEQDHSAFVVFKHSPRCYISKVAFEKFNAEYTHPSPFYVVNVITNRTTSLGIADTVKVVHQSPQVLVIKNGTCIMDESHEAIDAAQVLAQL